MGGLQHYRMSMDPAIQKLGGTSPFLSLSRGYLVELRDDGDDEDAGGAMTTNRHKYFRWTPRTARITFMYAVFVPAIFTFMAYQTDGKYDMRAKRKGDLISEY
ncbi:hypothetical protein DL768_009703 [Monosporascus sp. mg162]|nr:hypothetical protein DL768_009703 [Monosporascus sp. mg162]